MKNAIPAPSLSTVFLFFLTHSFCFSQTRIIPHLTRTGGGFVSSILINNATMHPHSYALHTYDNTGSVLSEVSGSIDAFDSLQVPASVLFSGEPVSHFTITEEDGESFLTACVAYQASSGRSSPAQVNETSEQKNVWRLFAGEWDSVFDGIAVVNTSTENLDIMVRQIGFNGEEIKTVKAISQLAPMGKGLYVIGGPSGSSFQDEENSLFEITSTGNFAITALRGTPPGSDVGYLWENALNSSREQTAPRMISHLTRSGGGFSSKLYFENSGNQIGQLNLQPYDQDGLALSSVELSIPAGETLVRFPGQVFNTEAERVSHFLISTYAPAIHTSVSYRIADGPGSPAQLGETYGARMLWRISPGNWSEIFDGFAVVNAGSIPSDVIVQQMNQHGALIHAELALKNLAPMAKGLYVIGGPGGSSFQDVEGSWFEIIGSTPLALTVLRGTPPGTPVGYLWKNGSRSTDDTFSVLTGLENTSCYQGGSLFGYLMQADSPVIVDSVEHAPPGSHALTQVNVIFRNIEDEVIATAVTDAAGRFTASHLPPELLFVEAEISGDVLRVPVRAIPFESIGIHAPVAFSRTEARDLILPLVTEGDLVLCTAVPLPAGTHIQPFIQAQGLVSQDQVSILDQDSWLFMVDSYPGQPFGHPVKYYLVGAETGSRQEVSPASWFPLVNYHPLWQTDLDYLTYPDGSFDEENLIFKGTAAPTIEAVQFPVFDEVDDTVPIAGKKFDGSILNEDVFFLLIFGEPVTGHTRVDEAKIYKFLNDNHISAENVYVVKTAEYNTLVQGVQAMGEAIRDINQEIVERLHQGHYASLTTVIFSHGGSMPLTQGTETPREGAFLLTDKHGNKNCLTAGQLTDLTLKKTKACMVRFVLPFCHSEFFALDLYGIYWPKEHDFLTVFAAAKEKEAFTYTAQHNGKTYLGGTFFIQKFIFNIHISNGDLEGVLVDDALNPVFVNLGEGAGQLAYERTPSWCGGSTSGVSLTPDPLQISLQEGYVCADSPEFIGRYMAENTLPFPVLLDLWTDRPETTATPENTRLDPGQTTWIDFYNVGPHGEIYILNFNLSYTDLNGENPVSSSWRTTVQPGNDLFGLTVFQSLFSVMAPGFILWWNYVDPYRMSTVQTLHSMYMCLSDGTHCKDTACTMGTQETSAAEGFYTEPMLDTLFGRGKNRKTGEVLYPCGQGNEGLTLCAELPLEGTEGDYLVISNVLQEPFDVADPDHFFQFGFVFDSDGDSTNNYQPSSSYPMDFYKDTDRWYSAEYRPDQGWNLKVTDARNGHIVRMSSAAKVVIRDYVVILMVPKSEFSIANPTYRITSFRHNGDYGLTSGIWDGYMYPDLDQPLEEIGGKVP